MRSLILSQWRDNNGQSRRACTASSEEQSASAGHHALAVTDHWYFPDSTY